MFKKAQRSKALSRMESMLFPGDLGIFLVRVIGRLQWYGVENALFESSYNVVLDRDGVRYYDIISRMESVHFDNIIIILVLSSMGDHIMYYLQTNDMQHSLRFQIKNYLAQDMKLNFATQHCKFYFAHLEYYLCIEFQANLNTYIILLSYFRVMVNI
jgi:hypothetical protein